MVRYDSRPKNGDAMQYETDRGNFLPSMEWVVGGASLLLLIFAGGLTLLAQMLDRAEDVARALLLFYLASWSYVAGIVVLSLLSIRLVVKRLLEWTNRRLKELSSAESPRQGSSHLKSDDEKQAHDIAA